MVELVSILGEAIDLEPGAYRLRLTVRDGDGREAVRAATLVVTRR